MRQDGLKKVIQPGIPQLRTSHARGRVGQRRQAKPTGPQAFQGRGRITVWRQLLHTLQENLKLMLGWLHSISDNHLIQRSTGQR